MNCELGQLSLWYTVFTILRKGWTFSIHPVLQITASASRIEQILSPKQQRRPFLFLFFPSSMVILISLCNSILWDSLFKATWWAVLLGSLCYAILINQCHSILWDSPLKALCVAATWWALWLGSLRYVILINLFNSILWDSHLKALCVAATWWAVWPGWPACSVSAWLTFPHRSG